ncbi:laccase [Hydrogenophaga crassostreae]|uniref:Purine nucleoside phosphorylase n=1 Tax=Hydrogenophaga crassostreae TaxID=1763535 RepID=A0A167IHN1_9BURK|nr:peptidoglycan editing factor PgeF [Hydrogenophaga crassostreae]AOW13085.1 laccase [Hydrogenophaga crassostreae]OAD42769.1 laccase [Hydrogenophaga crassostreae]
MAAAFPETWLCPQAGLPAGVRVVFTSRDGGVSMAPFDSLNLGDHVRDDPAAVAGNRAVLSRLSGAKPVFLQQVHGTNVALLSHETPDGFEADACVSDQRGLACTIMVADCLPVLFAHASGHVVAGAHAGWRGLAAGVLERCFEAYAETVQRAVPGTPRSEVAANTWVWLGPCIGPQTFEVGPEVKQAFVQHSAEAETCFESVAGVEGKHLANLSALASLRLKRLGLNNLQGNDGSPPWCTVSQPSRFFSHRRDAAVLGSTGRMAACIWIDG